MQQHPIRRATLGDLQHLPAIELAAARLFLEYAEMLGLDEASLLTAKPLEELRRGQAAGLLWVAVDGADRPVGFALATPLDGRLHLEEIDVLPAWGRRGIGAALLRTVCAEGLLRRQDVTLSTFREVPWNASFYAKAGFRPLTESELTPGLCRLREEETLRGLKTESRVWMLFDVAPTLR